MKEGFILSDEHAKKTNKPVRKNKQKRAHNGRKMEFAYSFFTIVLIFCLIQIGWGAILNVGKIISYKGKMITLENLLHQAQARNQDLKNEKRVVTSDNSLESIARNNLKMAGEDEVLIIINKKVEPPVKKKHDWKFLKFWEKKTDENPDVQNTDEIYIPSEVVEE
jgi:cell division protein FtsB